MTLREQLEERERQWRLFHGSEPAEPAPERDPAAVLADLSFLLRYYSREDIERDPDPDKKGIAAMRAVFALVSRS